MSIQIVYDSKTIDLLLGSDGLLTNYTQERRQARSGSGKIETINIHGIQEMAFQAQFTEAIYRDLVAWWSWARQGKAWAFAKDSGNTLNTTLSGAAAAGQAVISVNSTSTLANSDFCLVRALDNDDEYELIAVQSFVANTSITATANLKWSYSTDDLLRHLDYWPSVVSLDEDFNPKRDGDYYKHLFKFVENK